MGLISRLVRRYFVLRAIAKTERLFESTVRRVKTDIASLLVALSLVLAGVTLTITAISYFASSLHHALIPVLGQVGSNIALGLGYLVFGVIAVLLGFRQIHR